jgi:hypothetical protein
MLFAARTFFRLATTVSQGRRKSMAGVHREDLESLRVKLQQESSDGFALVSDIENNPYCAISVESSVPCVCVKWKRYVTSTQFRYIHEVIIEKLRAHGLTKALGDDSDLLTIHAEDRAWLINDWLPRAIAAGLRMAASKSPASHFGKISVESVVSALSPSIAVQVFHDLTTARNWLAEEAVQAG